MANQSRSAADIYAGVVQDVIDGVKQAFEDEGDENTLIELKNLWESKLRMSKALEPTSELRQVSNIYNPTVRPVTHIPRMQIQAQSLQHSNQILTIGNHQLSGSAQSAAQSLQRNIYQHISNFSCLVPPGSNNRPYLFNPQTHQFLAPTILSADETQLQTQPQALLKKSEVVQLDGQVDESSDEEFEDDDEDAEADEQEPEENNILPTVEDDPLNSGDDEADAPESGDIFDVENVVVCQFDKINRSKAKWKFHLKDGIMNLMGRDYLFQKATGDADF